jgi:hypothetical protein
MAVVLTELGVVVALVASIGARSFDRAGRVAVGKALACCLALIAPDLLPRPLGSCGYSSTPLDTSAAFSAWAPPARRTSDSSFVPCARYRGHPTSKSSLGLIALSRLGFMARRRQPQRTQAW